MFNILFYLAYSPSLLLDPLTLCRFPGACGNVLLVTDSTDMSHSIIESTLITVRYTTRYYSVDCTDKFTILWTLYKCTVRTQICERYKPTCTTETHEAFWTLPWNWSLLCPTIRNDDGRKDPLSWLQATHKFACKLPLPCIRKKFITIVIVQSVYVRIYRQR